MNSSDKTPLKGPDILEWAEDSGKRRFAPFATIAQKTEERKLLDMEYNLHDRDRERENRRLLYVAMTRPQAMLFVPKHKKDRGLAQRLEDLLKQDGNPNIALFDAERFCNRGHQENKPEIDGSEQIQLDDIPALSLQEFIIQETSYTQLNKKSNYFNDENKDDEYHTEKVEYTDHNSKNQPQLLKGGNLTGIALHAALENILGLDDINAIINDDSKLNDIVKKYLKHGVITDDMTEEEQRNAISQASSHIKDALCTPYPLPSGDKTVIADLPKPDRLPEIEFMLSCTPHRIRGFMDLVFRVRNDKHRAHPYKYYIIDWKSDILNDYDNDAVKRYCEEKNYLLQAQIYSLALDKYLKGILQEQYNRYENLGGSFHVFIRKPGSYWYRTANPQEDEGAVGINMVK
jgi:ATP-dependent exoDNAse (exonuclease V) beta subunit